MKQEEKSLQTKRMLANSLKRKMAEKPISKISVRELIDDCNLNRKTFYYHFEDIFALLKWVLEDEALETVANYNLILDLEEAIHFVMNYLSENKHILNCALDSMGREELKRFLVSDFNSVLLSNIKAAQFELGVSISEEYEHFLTMMYTEAIAGMIINWLRAKQDGEVSYITPENISLVMRSSLPAVLMATQNPSDIK